MVNNEVKAGGYKVTREEEQIILERIAELESKIKELDRKLENKELFSSLEVKNILARKQDFVRLKEISENIRFFGRNLQ